MKSEKNWTDLRKNTTWIYNKQKSNKIAYKIYKNGGAIIVEDFPSSGDLQVINPVAFDWSVNQTTGIYKVRDSIEKQDYELGIYSNVQNEAGAAYGSDALLQTALNSLVNATTVPTTSQAASVELVNAANIGAADDTYIDQGAEIDVSGSKAITYFVDFTVSDSTGNQIQVLSKHESAGTQEYVLESTADYKKTIGDSSIKIAYTFDTTGVNFLQLQSKATDVDTGGGTIGTFTIDYVLTPLT